MTTAGLRRRRRDFACRTRGRSGLRRGRTRWWPTGIRNAGRISRQLAGRRGSAGRPRTTGRGSARRWRSISGRGRTVASRRSRPGAGRSGVPWRNATAGTFGRRGTPRRWYRPTPRRSARRYRARPGGRPPGIGGGRRAGRTAERGAFGARLIGWRRRAATAVAADAGAGEWIWCGDRSEWWAFPGCRHLWCRRRGVVGSATGVVVGGGTRTVVGGHGYKLPVHGPEQCPYRTTTPPAPHPRAGAGDPRPGARSARSAADPFAPEGRRPRCRRSTRRSRQRRSPTTHTSST